MNKAQIIMASLIGAVVLAWIVNLFKLIFVALAQNWGATIVHALGLAGPVALVTVWF